MARRRAFKMARVKISNVVGDPAERTKLEMEFAEFEVTRQTAIEAHRKAMVAAADAAKAQSDFVAAQAASMAVMQKFLLSVGKFSTEVASEAVWYAFRKDGDIVLESPYTERTQRNMARAQMAMLDQHLNGKDNSTPSDDLYEDEDDTEESGGDKSNMN